MINCQPDHDTIQTALSLATRAPSINDSQPWLWRVGAQGLHLYADPDRAGLGADAHSRDVLLSCGAALHHCVVALAALGWRAKVHRLPDPEEPGHVAALELAQHHAGALDAALASAIPRRRSDWRPYSPWPVSTADMALIGARAARAGVTTRRVETLPELQHVVAQSVWRHTTPHGHAPKSDSTASMVPPPIAESEGDNAVVLALGTKDDTPLARLHAGEATSLVLLSATALGLASCPVAEPLETAEARDTLQANLFSIVGFPQMLLRIGWPPVDADSLPSPPRRSLTDVSEWLDHQSLNSA
ncbi:Acg family FMN-binding oxidoreductase [Mycobacterium sp. MMS18-G62]